MPPKQKDVKKRKILSSLTVVRTDGSVTREPIDYFNLQRTSTATGGSVADSEDPRSNSSTITNQFDHSSVIEGPTIKSRKEDETIAWQEIRHKLHSAFLESIVPSSDNCQNCEDHSQSLIVCYDCTSMPVMCPQCTVDHHTVNQFHNLIMFKDGLRCRFSFLKEMRMCSHTCSQEYVKSMDIFDRNGIIHSCEVTFCKCETEMESVVRCGFWPASPKEPACAISIQLLQWMKALLLETKSSLKSICQTLKWLHQMPEENISYLYRILTRETFEEFRHFHFKGIHTPYELEGLDDGSTCPACPSVDGEVFISLDANFGLVRKKNSGISYEPPKHKTRYFLDQAEVDAFVNNYGTQEVSKNESEVCSNFQATTAVRSKNKTANLDAKGVFGSACRHGVPRIFLSMKFGERYAYPALILKRLLESGSSTHYHIIYDIACKFNTHIKKSMPSLTGFDVALPVFHAYGHKYPCQSIELHYVRPTSYRKQDGYLLKVEYSTRWLNGYGLTDGECMERLWSYLRGFSHITKEMTPSHRIDLLSDALLHFAVCKVSNLATSLCLAAMKGNDVAQQSHTELQRICSMYNVSIETIQNWRQNDIASLASKRKATKEAKSSWQETYVQNLEIYSQLSLELALCEDPEQVFLINTHMKRVQEALHKTEGKYHIETRWTKDSDEYRSAFQALQKSKQKTLLGKMRSNAVEYAYLKEISKKYSDGQAIAHRVTGQMSRSSRSLKSLLISYNDSIHPEQPIPFGQAADPSSNLYYQLHIIQETSNEAVPFAVRRKAIDAFNLHQRATEELKIVEKEMNSFISFYKKQSSLLQTAISSFASPWTRQNKGLLILLRERKQAVDEIVESCSAQFQLVKQKKLDIEINELMLSDEEDTEEE